MPASADPAPFEPPTIDPREGEDWFQRLDEEAQDVVRARWVNQAAEWEDVQRRHARELLMTFALGFTSVLLPVLLKTLLLGGAGSAVLYAALAGVLAGSLWVALKVEELLGVIVSTTIACFLNFSLMPMGHHALMMACACTYVTAMLARRFTWQRFAPLA